MSGDNLPDSPIGPIGPMYITDFLDYLKIRNATSFNVVLATIEATRIFGPAVTKAETLSDSVFQVRVHIGYGLIAVIEMERDRTGALHPVLGEVAKL
jgi:hypothetical protein